jgi:hypothetical protein
MDIIRKQDKSVYYHVVNLFSTIPSVTIEDGFPINKELVLPSVAVEGEELFLKDKEMGNRRGRKLRLWSLDVYGSNKEQRDEIVGILFNNLDAIGVISVYDYDEGFPPSVSPTQLGVLKVDKESVTVTPIRIFPDLVEKLYWRSRIRFITEYAES